MDIASHAAGFRERGFAGPFPHFEPDNCASILGHLRDKAAPKPLEWHKGCAASDRAFYDLACDPRILEVVRALLGEDVVLWGASLQNRAPGRDHPWHCDMESCAAEGGFVSVWIGLKNTGAESGLKVIPGSHAYGKPVQQEGAEHGVGRGDLDDETVLGWARAHDAAAGIRRMEMRDGDVLFMDGRLWHGSENNRREGGRTALLLQFAAADRPVHRPDESRAGWPFAFDAARPPVIALSGAGDPAVNRLVAPPPPRLQSVERLRRIVAEVPVPLAPDSAEKWRPHGLFRTRGAKVRRLVSHVSVLSPGHIPHPPHGHEDDEMLFMLDGEAEIILADSEDDPAPKRTRMRPGMFSFYPAGQCHTLHNTSDAPATYMLLKWREKHARAEDAAQVPAGVFTHDGTERTLMEGTTRWLEAFHARTRALPPGAGDAAARHGSDRVVVLLEGALDLDGETVKAPAIMAIAAGERHALANPGDTPAAFLDFGLVAPPPADLGFARRLRRALLPA